MHTTKHGFRRSSKGSEARPGSKAWKQHERCTRSRAVLLVYKTAGRIHVFKAIGTQRVDSHSELRVFQVSAI